MSNVYGLAHAGGSVRPGLEDPFVARFHQIEQTPRSKAVGNFPSLLGHYEEWRAFIADAVEQDARPSPELIKANLNLAAWEAHLGIETVSSFPASVAIGATDVCNARCSFCAYVPERVSGRRVSLESVERSDWLKFSRSFRPNGSGLGEPFAHPQMAGILAAVRRNAPFIWMDSITNGSLINGAVTEAVVGFVQYLYISINAARAETYEATMRPLKWSGLIENLERLAEAKAKAGTDLPRLRAGYVCHRRNLEEVLEMPALLHRLGFEALNVNQMLVPPPFRSADTPLMDLSDSLHAVPEQADRVFRLLEKECQAQGIKLMKPLPSLSVLKSERGLTAEAAGRKAADSRIVASVAAFEAMDDPGLGDQEPGTDWPLVDASDDGAQTAEAMPGPPVQQRNERRSYEWIPFEGQSAICWAPWRVLKVDIFGKTQNCCGFFEKMAEFDWPTAKTFHRLDGMWNHETYRHLRKTMGKPDELPFCTFCKEDDKRHPDAAASKRDASIRSGLVMQEIYDRTAPFQFRGTLSGIDGDLSEWATSLSLFPAVQIAPFRRDKLHYRRMVRTRGFWDLGRVVVFGVSNGAVAAFLAEANSEVILADPSLGRLRSCTDVLKALSMEVHASIRLKDDPGLELDANSVDGVWIDGPTLGRFGFGPVLAEVRRVLKRGGRLAIHGAHGVGELLRTAARTGDAGIADLIEDASRHDGPGGFVDTENIVARLRRARFNLDRARPPLIRYLGAKARDEDAVSDMPAIAEAVRAMSANPPEARSESMFWGQPLRIGLCATAI
jgi:SAM-dependent methyltransferase